MKKVVLATFLACAVASFLPVASAQGAPSGVPTTDPCAVPPMSNAEYQVYNNATTQTDPKALAAALEQYLSQYPQSAVQENTLERLIALYNSFDAAKELDAADRLLKVDPNDITALVAEAALRKGQADAITDPTAKQAGLDSAASYAQKGLAAPKPACTSDATFTTEKNTFYPTFYSVIGYAAFNKKDSATAIGAYKKEIAIVPPDATKTPGNVLLDIFYLAETYEQATPPDYLNCAFYATRAVVYAPDNFKAQLSPTAKYCYHRYHGPDDDGYDSIVAAATANVNPPDGLFASIKPAPTPAEKIHGIITSTPETELPKLAISDKELIFQYGSPEDAAKVWDTIKGNSVQLSGLVIASTPAQLQVAVSEDAVQAKTADFTVNLTPLDPLPDEPKAPAASATPAAKAAYKAKLAAYKKAKDQQDAIAAASAVGQTVTFSGTYDSFTPNPVMITMKDGEVILPKAATPKPAPHPTAHKAAAH